MLWNKSLMRQLHEWLSWIKWQGGVVTNHALCESDYLKKLNPGLLCLIHVCKIGPVGVKWLSLLFIGIKWKYSHQLQCPHSLASIHNNQYKLMIMKNEIQTQVNCDYSVVISLRSNGPDNITDVQSLSTRQTSPRIAMLLSVNDRQDWPCITIGFWFSTKSFSQWQHSFRSEAGLSLVKRLAPVSDRGSVSCSRCRPTIVKMNHSKTSAVLELSRNLYE